MERKRAFIMTNWFDLLARGMCTEFTSFSKRLGFTCPVIAVFKGQRIKEKGYQILCCHQTSSFVTMAAKITKGLVITSLNSVLLDLIER